ncbi:hypothetical protein [Lysobacter sp. F6437]|uniref:hypothetical protein n=1 Tax=Lysobacter sp. F6437 TaxID=3459296 RepID=UPI00403DB5B8
MHTLNSVCCVLISIGLVSVLGSCEKSKERSDHSADVRVQASSKIPLQPSEQAGGMSNRNAERLAGEAPPAASWGQLLSILSHEEREVLTRANHRYMGLLEFSSPQEYDALVKAGFPKPKEWLAFQEMSDYEIEKRVHANEKMARLFYADRLIQRVELASGRFGERAPEVERIAIDATVQAATALKGGRDPFSAYVYGKVSSVQLGMPEPLAAGIMLASDRGDLRAKQILHLFSKAQPDLRLDIVHVQYQDMKRAGHE